MKILSKKLDYRIDDNRKESLFYDEGEIVADWFVETDCGNFNVSLIVAGRAEVSHIEKGKIENYKLEDIYKTDEELWDAINTEKLKVYYYNWYNLVVDKDDDFPHIVDEDIDIDWFLDVPDGRLLDKIKEVL